MTEPGDRLGTNVGGKYRIVKLLGAGGMGVVYEALHVVVKRRFAIKFLRADLALRRDVLARFQREAEAAGALENENIAAAMDFGIAPDGAPYIVMEYLAGLDLARLLSATGPLPVERAADLVIQACRGIHEAHAAGVIHRDLKPENLFVCRRNDGSDLVKIVDFGIAKLQASDAGNAVTRTGGMVGTPSYMSPEQARGDTTIDQRSDVYSLGVILYELLSGQVPHPGGSYNAVIYHISTQPALPLAREGQELPRDLVEVVNRALSLRPEDRLASAEALAEELTAFARRVVWPKITDGVPPHRDTPPSSEAGAHELPGTSPGSTWVAGEPPRKSLGWRAPAVVAIGLAIGLALLLSVRGLSHPKSEPDNNAARAAPSPDPPIPSERASPVELTAPPPAASSLEERASTRAPASAPYPGRPTAPRGRPEGRPTSSAASEAPAAAGKSTTVSSGQATFDPRNPYE
jgi:eukaryotic-like serine/threonine-protein kinase